VSAGGWATLLMCVVGAVYTAAFAEPSHRLGLALSVAVAALGGAAALWCLPWKQIIAAPWREWAFFAWTALTIAVISATAAADGGATSPLALMIFLPVVFASLAYPLRLVIWAAVLAQSAYLLLVLLGSDGAPGAGHVIAFCGALAGAAVLAGWQAGNHDAWRRELARSSCTDPLTGLLNRRGFSGASASAFSALERHGRPITLLVIDLDLFKAYNDAHGHHAGDALLRSVSGRLQDALRPSDSAARLGGDEFAVLLPDTDAPAATAVIDRMEADLRQLTGLSIGRATAPEQGVDFDDLYRAADADLYRRKVAGERSAGEIAAATTVLERRRQRRSIPADAVLAGVTEAFYVLDEEWRFLYINEEAERLLLRRAQELLGKRVWEEFPEAANSTFEQVFRRVIATGVAETFTEHYEPLERTFSVKASPIPGGISVYFHDVSGWIEPGAEAGRTLAGQPASGTRALG
jgi:diguanylate cyclase (GGDEF)-like protein